MEKSIVVGVDGSEDSKAALAVAEGLADRLGARLVLANVVEYAHSPNATLGPMGPGIGAPVPFVDAGEQVQAAEALLERIVEEADVEAETRVVAGLAGERLADLADQEDAAMVVVGSRGRGAFKAAFLGSVSTSLIGVARRPVLVVPPGAREQ